MYNNYAVCKLYKVIPDVKVVSNLPALNMEETIPSAVSDATLLAPQEVEVGCSHGEILDSIPPGNA